MIVQITLVAGTERGGGSQVEVETAMSIDTNDPRWTTSLVDGVTQHAQEGARRLLTHLTPPLPAGWQGFVPLADVAPQINIPEIDR